MKNAWHSGLALVVDGDPAAARVLSQLLEALGLSCFRTPSGRLALRLARARPVLAVVDTWLSDMSGVDLARRLAAEGLLVVVTDGSGNPAVEVLAREAGITHFARKPVSAAELGVLVRHALSLRDDHVPPAVAKQAPKAPVQVARPRTAAVSWHVAAGDGVTRPPQPRASSIGRMA